MGLCRQSQPRRRADGRARLRGVPDRPHEGGLRHRSRATPSSTMTIQETGGTRQDDRAGRRRASRRCCRIATSVQRETAAGLRAHAGAAMRRLGRLFRHHRQPGARRRRRPARRAMAAPPSCRRRPRSTAPSTCSPAARSRREVGEKLVERIHWWEDYTARNGGEMNNNPSPGNKAGGLTTILEKSLGRGGQGRHHAADGVYEYAEPVTREGLRLHGHARLRPGLGHRPGGRRRQRDVLHHRPRLGLRLQADALDQARHQQPTSTAA